MCVQFNCLHSQLPLKSVRQSFLLVLGFNSFFYETKMSKIDYCALCAKLNLSLLEKAVKVVAKNIKWKGCNGIAYRILLLMHLQ